MILDRAASTLLFGLAANVDNFTIGVAYGIKQRRIGWWQNLLIATVTTAITLVAMAFGRQIREALPSRMPDILGGAMLLIFAIWNIYRERAGTTARPAIPGAKFAGRLSVGVAESLFLSASLSINNVGLAIAGGIGGIGYRSAAISIFSFSLAMLAFGQAVATNLAAVSWVPSVLRHPVSGNAALALTGVLMLAGY